MNIDGHCFGDGPVRVSQASGRFFYETGTEIEEREEKCKLPLDKVGNGGYNRAYSRKAMIRKK